MYGTSKTELLAQVEEIVQAQVKDVGIIVGPVYTG